MNKKDLSEANIKAKFITPALLKTGWDEQTHIAQILSDMDSEIETLKKELAKHKQAEKELDEKLYTKYPTLTKDEVKQSVVEDKWMKTIKKAIKCEIDHISQQLTNRIKELAKRYETPLPQIDKEVAELEIKVNTHLTKMGFVI